MITEPPTDQYGNVLVESGDDLPPMEWWRWLLFPGQLIMVVGILAWMWLRMITERTGGI